MCHVTGLSTDREGGAGQALSILFHRKLPLEEIKYIQDQARSSGVVFFSSLSMKCHSQNVFSWSECFIWNKDK